MSCELKNQGAINIARDYFKVGICERSFVSRHLPAIICQRLFASDYLPAIIWERSLRLRLTGLVLRRLQRLLLKAGVDGWPIHLVKPLKQLIE